MTTFFLDTPNALHSQIRALEPAAQEDNNPGGLPRGPRHDSLHLTR